MTRAPAQKSALGAVTTAGSSRPKVDHNGGSGVSWDGCLRPASSRSGRRTLRRTRLRLGLHRAGQVPDLDEVVCQDHVSGPDPGSSAAVQAGVVPAVTSFEAADPAFDRGSFLPLSVIG